jgi:hypothetical protein
MVTLTLREQVAPTQKVPWEWADLLRLLALARDRCLLRVRLRNRLSYFVALGLAAALAALPFSGAATGQKLKVPANSFDEAASWQLPDTRSSIGDGALYLHSKLMQVATSRSGAPVLRFVECRHYTREHLKLVQTSMTPAGSPVLRFVPGDYCQFGSVSTSLTTVARLSPGSEPLLAAKDESPTSDTPNAQSDPLKELLTPYQRYACEKFGPACRVALAIQFAENPQGACEIYHYNSTNGTLDWGFFQINTVHLTRAGLNLRDLLDCKKNIDFAYQLFREQGFAPWMTYMSGAYRRFLFQHEVRMSDFMAAQRRSNPIDLLHLSALQQPGQSRKAAAE